MKKKMGARSYERRFIVVALVASVSVDVSAANVGKGDDIVVRGPGGLPQSWYASGGGRLSSEDGAEALSVVAYGATVSLSQAVVSAPSGVALLGNSGTDFLVRASRIESANNVAVSLPHIAHGEVFTRPSRLTVVSSKLSGQRGAVEIDGHARAGIVDSEVVSVGAGSDAVVLGTGSLEVSGQSIVRGQRSGVTVVAGLDAPLAGDGRVTVSASTISSDSSAAIRIAAHPQKDVSANFTVLTVL